jgi:hypothetical protein
MTPTLSEAETCSNQEQGQSDFHGEVERWWFVVVQGWRVKWHWPMFKMTMTVPVLTFAGRTVTYIAALIQYGTLLEIQTSNAVARNGSQPSVPPRKKLACLENN